MTIENPHPRAAHSRSDHAAWAPVSQATVLATGTDAVRFVNNFVTAAVGAVGTGCGTEAFVTDSRGWVIALVTILRTDAGLELLASPGLGERLRDHLEHYHIREAVELIDASDTTRTIIVSGTGAAEAITAFLPTSVSLPTVNLGHVLVDIGGHTVRLVRVEGQGADGFWIRGEPAAMDAIAAAVDGAGLPRASAADLEASRIMAGYPSASDIPEKTLPQELGRDALAISFTKGCYLGQETVARLDALGHVNRRLAIIAIETDALPACPAEIHSGTETLGTLTSSCKTAPGGTTIGLGIVHAKALETTPLTIAAATARVIAVPPSRMQQP